MSDLDGYADGDGIVVMAACLSLDPAVLLRVLEEGLELGKPCFVGDGDEPGMYGFHQSAVEPDPGVFVGMPPGFILVAVEDPGVTESLRGGDGSCAPIVIFDSPQGFFIAF